MMTPGRPPDFSLPSAVVLGACGHGLAIIRALARAGIEVIIIEAEQGLPGAHTRYGKIHPVAGMDADHLIGALHELSLDRGRDHHFVLFLTNDAMVREFSARRSQIPSNILFHEVPRAADLVEKAWLAEHCQEKALNYPASCVIDSIDDIDRVIDSVGFPMILKPVRPLSGFKTYLPKARAELKEFIILHSEDLPIISQCWIPGDDTKIYFVAQYRSNEQVLCEFVGRKLRSRPMGHTTVAEPAFRSDVIEIANRFFSGLNLSGPASLELKLDQDGSFWIIEPTIGRTDFWVDVCIENGVNIPLVQYMDHSGVSCSDGQEEKRRIAIWFNEYRDPFSFLWYLFLYRGAIVRRRAVFVYASLSDPAPFLFFLLERSRGLFNGLRRRLLAIITFRRRVK